MKNLIILGVPRAGKSTLAKYVVEQLIDDGVPVTLMSADALIGGLTARRNSVMWKIFVRPWRHVFPFMRRTSKRKLQKDMRRFITRFFDETSLDFPVIFEGAYISPNEAMHMFDAKKCKIVVVGYPNTNASQKLADIRKFDKDSPLSKLNKHDANHRIHGLIETSKKYQLQSLNKFVFLDTSTDYHETLRDFAKNVSKFLQD